MKMLRQGKAAALALALLSPAAFAATQEEALATITELMVAMFAAFVVTVIVGVYFGKAPEER